MSTVLAFDRGRDAIPRQAAPVAVAPAVTAPGGGLDTGPHSLLRFITCGSVDDGKSTLIGRVLYDAGAVFEDQLDALDRDSRKFGTQGESLDFALLVDGLSAEREQGITIDVAYRYFATPRRSFIVADTPGHEQYTRNMATGASTADLAVILVDARKGLLPQTRRHSFIVSMVGVRHVVLAVNKMDLVGYDEAVFRRIEADYRAAVEQLGFAAVTCIPVSARDGENVTKPSSHMAWYDGPALLPWLETVDVSSAAATAAFVMPVQWVNRPDADFRGFSGTVASGEIAVGAAMVALPSGRSSRIARIVTADGDLPRAVAGQSITLTLEDEIDLSRGDVITSVDRGDGPAPRLAAEIHARVLVTGDAVVAPGRQFLARLGSATANATVVSLEHAIDIERYATVPANELRLNGIGAVVLRFDRPLVVADYAAIPELGGFILIDRLTNQTAAFGFVDGVPAVRARDDVTAPAIAEDAWPSLVLAWAGEPGTERRLALWKRVTWRLAGAALFGIVALLAGGGLTVAGAIVAADLVLRPAVRFGHERLWRWADARRAADDVLEGGDGI